MKIFQVYLKRMSFLLFLVELFYINLFLSLSQVDNVQVFCILADFISWGLEEVWFFYQLLRKGHLNVPLNIEISNIFFFLFGPEALCSRRPWINIVEGKSFASRCGCACSGGSWIVPGFFQDQTSVAHAASLEPRYHHTWCPTAASLSHPPFGGFVVRSFWWNPSLASQRGDFWQVPESDFHKFYWHGTREAFLSSSEPRL